MLGARLGSPSQPLCPPRIIPWFWVVLLGFAAFVRPLAVAQSPVTQPRTDLALTFSAPAGLFESDFSLQLGTTPTPSPEGLTLRYTTDGQVPSPTVGSTYTTPLSVTNSLLVRVAAFRAGTRVSPVATRSFLRLAQAIRQSAQPPGFPAGPEAWDGEPSVYGMDPQVTNDPAYRDRLEAAFRSLPVLSVVCPRPDLFGARNGIYIHPLQRGDAWERACSVELIPSDATPGFQVDAGIQIQGNYNRIPEKSPKHSLRLLFKQKYGPTKLAYRVFPDSPVKKFDTLVLRADYNNSWIHWDAQVRARGQRTRDAWLKDSHRAMGWTAAHNRYVHLFLCGLYWGVYDLAERPDASFAAAYLGGDREDFDAINESEAKDGTTHAYDVLRSMDDLSRLARYDQLSQRLDVPAYIDYLLLNYYGGNRDWGENKNWYAIRRRQPAGPFRFYVWDGEQILQGVGEDIVNQPYEIPFNLALELRDSAEFRLAFADRAQCHLFGQGALTPAAVTERWLARAREVDLAIVAESARWGGFRRNPPYTRDRDWLKEQTRLLKTYFPQRTAILLQQLRGAGLYPSVPAPSLTVTAVPSGGHELTLSAPQPTLYYTTNGLDPRVRGAGTVSPDARSYTGPLRLAAGQVLKCRVQQGGVWSALVEAAPGTKSPP
jgi:hypothetical protein